MKSKKLFLGVLTIIITITSINTICFATTDRFKSFNTWDMDTTAGVETVSLATLTFQKLGYINDSGTDKFSTTSSRSTILNYISGTGKNYGFFINSHGNSSCFNPKTGDVSQRIYPSDITGYWHLVFLSSCSSAASDNFANAFHTVGYDNRAFLGWYKDIQIGGNREWWGYFYPQAGTTDLRNACLLAADKCSYSTPIRMYGDKSWDGKAW